MNGPTPWLDELRGIIRRQAGDDDPAEQISLAAQDVLGGVPDYEICEALRYVRRDEGDPLCALLAAECARRDLDV